MRGIDMARCDGGLVAVLIALASISTLFEGAAAKTFDTSYITPKDTVNGTEHRQAVEAHLTTDRLREATSLSVSAASFLPEHRHVQKSEENITVQTLKQHGTMPMRKPPQGQRNTNKTEL